MSAMFSNRIAFCIAALMVLASIGAVLARPTVKAADEGPPISLEHMIPRQFGDWRRRAAALRAGRQSANPGTGLDKLLQPDPENPRIHQFRRLPRDVVARVRQQPARLAAGAQARGLLSGAGFPSIEKNTADQLESPFGEIPVRRLFGHLGARYEPVTYWFTVGRHAAVQGATQKKLVELRFGLTGRIPDGLLYRRVIGRSRRSTRLFDAGPFHY